MKTLKDFLREQNMPFDGVRSGIIDVQDKEVRENINILLNRATHEKYLTPYIAFERVSKVLANFLIFVPNQGFMEGDFGNAVIPVEQFGIKAGMDNMGQFISKGEVEKDFTHGPHAEGEGNEEVSKPQDISHFVYFEYQLGDCGMFNVFCQIVDQEELDEILADLEEESQEDDKEDEDLYESKEERLDEVSKKGLLQYTDTALADMSQADFGRGKYGDKTGERAKRGDKRQKGIYLAVKKLAGKAKVNATNEGVDKMMKEGKEKDDPPFEPTGSTTNAKTPRNVAKRLAQKAMKQAKEKAANKK